MPGGQLVLSAARCRLEGLCTHGPGAGGDARAQLTLKEHVCRPVCRVLVRGLWGRHQTPSQLSLGQIILRIAAEFFPGSL